MNIEQLHALIVPLVKAPDTIRDLSISSNILICCQQETISCYRAYISVREDLAVFVKLCETRYVTIDEAELVDAINQRVLTLARNVHAIISASG